MGGLLGSHRSLSLSQRCRRGGVDDAPDLGSRGGPDDILRPSHVDLEHRRRIADAEGIRAGVVDEAAAVHRGCQRLEIEHVAWDRLGAQLAERAGRGLRPRQRLDALAVGEQPLENPPADKPRAPGDEEGAAPAN